MNLPAMQETQVQCLGQEYPLEKANGPIVVCICLCTCTDVPFYCISFAFGSFACDNTTLYIVVLTHSQKEGWYHGNSGTIIFSIRFEDDGGDSGKEPACQCRRCKRLRFNSWVLKIPWRRAWQSTPVFLPEESHGQRSLAGYSPQGCKELDMTEATLYTNSHT